MSRSSTSLLLGLVFGSQLALAQVTTGTVSGRVMDETGAVVPGATVTIRNLDTGITRTMSTDSQGRYSAPSLGLGNYEVQAEMVGFQTEVRTGITLTVGREAVVDLMLHLGTTEQRIVVTGEAPLIETTSSAVAGLVNQQQMRELPLNLRSYEQLAAFQAGVTAVRVGGSAGPSGGVGGTALVISGARPEFSSFKLDNATIVDPGGKTPGSAAGAVMGVEAVREFTVITNSYNAEYSRAAGGVINSVTRSGTNEFHGSVYEFLRNDNLDAANFFDNAAGRRKPEFRRNQFGFSVGGPIRKDQAFFFGNYEGLREGLGRTTTNVVPNENARNGLLPDPSRPGGLRDVEVAPAVRPYLALYPLPNGNDLRNGTADLIAGVTNTTREDFFVVRLDHRISDADSLFGRFQFDDADTNSPSGLIQSPVGDSSKKYFSFGHTRIFSPQLISNFRFSYNRSVGISSRDAVAEVPKELLFVPLPGRVLGRLEVSGLSSLGHTQVGPRFATQNHFGYAEDLIYTRGGSHSLKFGVNVERFRLNGFGASRYHGFFRFSDLISFLTNQPRSFEVGVPTPLGGAQPRGMRQSLVGFYVQDDYRVTPSLTWNLGLRYEFITVPTEVAGRIANLRKIDDTATVVGDPLFENPSLKNLAPRFGFAWAPWGSLTTSVRGGMGIFYDQFLPPNWSLSAFMNGVPPITIRAVINNPVFPDEFVRRFGTEVKEIPLPPNTAMNTLEFTPPNPYMMQYNLTVQRQVAPDTVLSVAYVGSRGVHLARAANLNIALATIQPDGRKFFPATATRRNPIFGDVVVDLHDANSSYHSLQVELRKRFSHGVQSQVSYTFARSMDEASGIIGNADFSGASKSASSEPYDHRFDRGPSAFDVQHTFVLNFLLDLPFGRGRALGSNLAGAWARLIEGWRLNSILSLDTGARADVVFSANTNRSRNLDSQARDSSGGRPDLKPGASHNPIDSRNPDRYIDPASFQPQELGYYGNLGRNVITLPGLATFDLSLTKDTRVSERVNLQFRFELFNLFNRANFGAPDNTIFIGTPAAPVLSSTFGRIRSSATSSRQIQFGLKLLF